MAEVAPLRLPQQLLTLWRRIDVTSLAVCPHPDLSEPSFALQSWQRIVRDQGGVPVPRAMFPVCYESWSFRWIELEDGLGHGGGLFDWGFAGSPYRLDHVDLAAFVDQFATMVELGEVRTVLHEGQPSYEFDPDEVWEDITSVRLSGAPAVLGYSQREMDEDVRRWPAHWLASSHIPEEARTPRGATTSISALLAGAAAGQDAQGTVQARIAGLAGTAEGSQLVLDDGTGTVEIWCPATLSPYGPIVGRQFEFDVVIFAGTIERPDISGLHCEINRHVADRDLAGAQAAAAEMYERTFGTPWAGMATGLRPLD